MEKILTKIKRRAVSPADLASLRALRGELLKWLDAPLNGEANAVASGIIKNFVNDLKGRYNVYDQRQLPKQLKLLKKHPLISSTLDKVFEDRDLMSEFPNRAIDSRGFNAWLQGAMLAKIINSPFEDVAQHCALDDLSTAKRRALLELGYKLRRLGNSVEHAATIRKLNELIKSDSSLLPKKERLQYLQWA